MTVASENTNGTNGTNGADVSQASRAEKQEARLAAILTLLQQAGAVSVEELSTKLDVSVVTIRRDLSTLEERGLLRRTHGGAELIQPLFYEPFRNDRSFQAQVERYADEKRRIGRAAAAFIKPGDTIALTPGTTTTEVIRGLPLNYNITVVTNTVNVAMELSKRKDLSVFVTGGFLRGDWFSLVGPAAIEGLGKTLISLLFIGCDGIDVEWGATCYNPDEADVNGTMVKNARRRIAVADHSKFGKVAGWRICLTNDIDVLITDSGATDEMIEPFVKRGIEVIRA